MVIEPVLYPISDEIGPWESLMNTLYNWQSVNSAIIALLAALLAVFITVRSEFLKKEKQRQVYKEMLGEGMSVMINHLNQTVDIIEQNSYMQGEQQRVDINDILRPVLQRIENLFLVTKEEDDTLKKHIMTWMISLQLNNQILISLDSAVKKVGSSSELCNMLKNKLNEKNLSDGEINEIQEHISRLDKALTTQIPINEETRDIVAANYKKLIALSTGLNSYCFSQENTYCEKTCIKPYINEPIEINTFTN
ncbi:hypothetical protein [Vibrio cyclitrophicus]|uniref:hypothetical protein n=1 Tax=Vibrio cyclitrophicus TaxID=47951 RepID=UPI00148E4B82|nr:hypothetical protein [Vibrio cyclitrophicus]NOH19469.1 hypothetical protein [Vibrio cyclitrophicus]